MSQNLMIFDTLVVERPRLRSENIGSVNVAISSEQLRSDETEVLDHWLRRNTTVHLRSNGPASSSSPSIRGSTGSQVVVTWNGIPIQQFQLGVFDISLLPNAIISNAKLIKGGASSIWGSGAIGGVLDISSQTSSEEGTYIGVSLGSFGKKAFQLNHRWQERKWRFSSSFWGEQVENDFPYFNDEFEVSGIVNNASKKHHSWLQAISYLPSDKSQLDFYLWLQSVNRHIPPNLLQNSSVAQQDDYSFRTMIRYYFDSDRLHHEFKLAYFNETLDYSDRRILLFSESDLSAMIFEYHLSPASAHLSKFPWMVGYAARSHRVKSSILTGIQREQIHAFFGSLHRNLGKWRFQLSTRWEVVQNGESAPVFSFGGEYALSNTWFMLFKFGKNYRFPTVNDRFYNPGGNEDLLSEDGWSQELSFSHKGSIQTNITVFNRYLRNGIIWARLPGELFFSSHNLSESWSRGIEAEIEYTLPLNQSALFFKIQATHLKSTNQKEIKVPKIRKGQALFYTPRWKGTAHASWNWNKMFWALDYRYTASSEGISAQIKPYSLLDLSCRMEDLDLLGNEFSIGWYVNNIFDQYYELTEYYPMPGRNYTINLNLKID